MPRKPARKVLQLLTQACAWDSLAAPVTFSSPMNNYLSNVTVESELNLR